MVLGIGFALKITKYVDLSFLHVFTIKIRKSYAECVK